MDDRQLDELFNNRIAAAKRESSLHTGLLIILALAVCAALVFSYIHLKRAPDGSPVPSPALSQEAEASPTPRPTVAPTPTPEPTPEATSDEPENDTETPSEAGAPVQGQRELTTHRVTLYWSPAENAPTEPIRLRVLHSGLTVTELTLRPEDAWTAEWKDLYRADELELQGRFPGGVTASVTVVGQRFDVKCDAPSPLGTAAAPSPSSRLPQTGEAVWPISLLLALGVLCIAAAVLLRRRSRKS